MPTTFDFTYNITDPAEDNEQLNALGKARAVEFRPSSFFFTELSVNAQTDVSGAYGPVGTGTTQFNITTKLNLANKKAFAVTAGQVLVVPQNGSADKVNIIIKPLKTTDIGVPVKYFVYRGVKKDMFVSGLNIIAKSSSNTPFIAKIWKDYLLLNFNSPPESEPTNINIPASYIGYNDADDNTIVLDEKFFKVTEGQSTGNNFNLPHVEAGQYFGDFADADFGFEIVLDTVTYAQDKPDTGFQIDIAYARKKDLIINTADITSLTNVSEKMYRENVLRFMDPAAFYGAHITSNNLGTIKIGNDPGATYSLKTDIYQNILSKFLNKNKIYLYIKGARNRSYNYNGLLGSNDALKIGTSGTPVATAYSTQGWPVVIVTSDETHNESESESKKNINKLVLNLKFETSQKRGLLYNVHGNNVNAGIKNNFLIDDALIGQNPSATVIYTNDIKYNLNNTYGIENTQLTGIKSCADFIFINYDEIREDYLNDVFGPVNALPTIKPSINTGNSIIREVSHQTKIVHRGDYARYMENHVLFQGGIQPATDETPEVDNRVRLYVAKMLYNSVDGETKLYGSKGQSCSIIKTAADYAKFIYGTENYFLIKGVINDAAFTNNITSLQLLNFNELGGNAEDHINLGITETEYNKLRYNSTGVPTEPVNNYIPVTATNFTFCFKDKVTDSSLHYSRYTVGIKYDTPQGITAEIYPTIETIFVYTLDEHYFFSKAYSEKVEYAQEFSPAIMNFGVADDYVGEFGFDWLRLGGHSVKIYADNIPNDYTEHAYKDIVQDGYAKGTFNWFSSLLTFGSNLLAYKSLKREYINLATSEVNKMYFVPYLTLPPLATFNIIYLKTYIENTASVSRFEVEADKTYITAYFDEELSKLFIEYETFEKDQYIKIKAYPATNNGNSQGNLCGIIKVLANSAEKWDNLKTVIIYVRTNVAGNEKIGSITGDEEGNFKLKLQQLYIKADINKPQDYILDMGNHVDFQVDAGNIFTYEGQHYINYNGPTLFSSLTQKLDAEKPEYKQFFKIFVFDMPSMDPVSHEQFTGRAEDIGKHNLCIFSGRSSAVLPHEMLHSLGLRHTHIDVGTPIEPQQKYTYIKGNNAATDADKLKATENMMSYLHIRRSLWHWQMQIVKKNIKQNTL